MAIASVAPRRRRRIRRGVVIKRTVVYLAAVAFTLWIGLPLWFTLTSSFTTPSAFGQIPAPLWPTSPTLDNFIAVLGLGENRGTSATSEVSRVVTGMFHSFLVAGALVIIDLIIAALSAYGLSRYRYRGSQTFFTFVVLSRVVPGIALIGPFFVAFRVSGILDTPFFVLLISYQVFTLPLAIMLLKSYFDQIPREVEEAGAIGGAGRRRSLWSIVTPLAVPGLVATAVLVFLESWSELFFAMTMTSQWTVPPILAGFQSLQNFAWTELAAATVLTLIPPVAVAMIFQRFVVAALASGTGK